MSQSIEVMTTIIGGWRPGIDPWTFSPQGQHANHYTNGDRQELCTDVGEFCGVFNLARCGKSHVNHVSIVKNTLFKV